MCSGDAARPQPSHVNVVELFMDSSDGSIGEIYPACPAFAEGSAVRLAFTPDAFGRGTPDDLTGPREPVADHPATCSAHTHLPALLAG